MEGLDIAFQPRPPPSGNSVQNEEVYAQVCYDIFALIAWMNFKNASVLSFNILVWGIVEWFLSPLSEIFGKLIGMRKEQ